MNWKISILCFLVLIISCKSEPKQDKDNESNPAPEISTEASEEVTESASTVYSNTLELQGISFAVAAASGKLTVTPSGLETSNEPMEWPIEGNVTGAEVEDLNADGWPELFVYTQSPDETKQANVYAFSVFNGKSMGMVSFPPLLENAEASEGYVGGDEFAVVENTLVQRFILANGNTRQIQYKMVAGEAMPALVIDKVVEY
ncbi:hypothetical protein E7Z59_06820 [Robertkochia marina]|uniref:VCBS repeat-containing protein n=1 Tax=Robertkochia marina TaxID=1227945 RepID=A0A4S3M1F5_9FLAO|nr:hypothetical protein [Robertkochia marina]THD67369.1 hypothetical protein E7Z59_06820 [Robertkochia marina]TRZ43024.1 hypothetical protein D3A96_11125 [Robertkochia marina]